MLIAECGCLRNHFKFLPISGQTLQHDTLIASYDSTLSAEYCGYICSKLWNCSSFSYDDTHHNDGKCVLSAANPVPTIGPSHNKQIYIKGTYVRRCFVISPVLLISFTIVLTISPKWDHLQ